MTDLAFWAVAAAMALIVLSSLVLTLLRGGQEAAEAGADHDLRVYRDQLREVERDLARGLIGDEDAARLRTEVSRRVLDADRAARSAPPAPKTSRATPLLAALVIAVIGGAGVLYWRIGAPGYPDMPLQARFAGSEAFHKDRPTQAQAEAEVPPQPAPKLEPDYAALLEKLRTTVKDRPDDQRGLELLARNEAQTGNFAAAYAAQGKLVTLRGADASAEDYAGLAELMILAANGYVSPEAEAALIEALKRDPQNGTAIYYSGQMFAQIGRADRTFDLWRPLLERSGPTDPWVEPIRAQIEAIASQAGVGYTLPDAAPGPTGADVEAAAAMTPEERTEMIKGMVAQLSDRLAREGGPAAEWARLITAYGVLGDTAQATTIWTEAQTRFAERPEDLTLLRDAAVKAGVAK